MTRVEMRNLNANEVICNSFRQSVLDARGVKSALKLTLSQESWRRRLDLSGNMFECESFVDYITAEVPRGCEQNIDDIRRIVSGDPETLSMFDEAVRRKRGGGKNQHSDAECQLHNVQEAPTGNTSQRAHRMLRDKRPDLHAKVLSGELSAHGAMLEAGFRRPTMTVRLDDAAACAAALRRRADDKFIDQLKRELAK